MLHISHQFGNTWKHIWLLLHMITIYFHGIIESSHFCNICNRKLSRWQAEEILSASWHCPRLNWAFRNEQILSNMYNQGFLTKAWWKPTCKSAAKQEFFSDIADWFRHFQTTTITCLHFDRPSLFKGVTFSTRASTDPLQGLCPHIIILCLPFWGLTYKVCYSSSMSVNGTSKCMSVCLSVCRDTQCIHS